MSSLRSEQKILRQKASSQSPPVYLALSDCRLTYMLENTSQVGYRRSICNQVRAKAIIYLLDGGCRRTAGTSSCRLSLMNKQPPRRIELAVGGKQRTPISQETDKNTGKQKLTRFQFLLSPKPSKPLNSGLSSLIN